MADVEQLTPEQSAARIAQLEAEGWIVERVAQPDGTVVVTKRRPGANALGWALILVALGGCWVAARGRW